MDSIPAEPSRPQQDIRLVLDTSVIVAAVRSNVGQSNPLLRAGLQGRYKLLVSVPLLLEYEAVLTRPNHVDASGLGHYGITTVLDAITGASTSVLLHMLWRPQLPDPDDDMVLETAINGQATAIATFNARHFGQVPRRFGISILSPREVLDLIGR